MSRTRVRVALSVLACLASQAIVSGHGGGIPPPPPPLPPPPPPDPRVETLKGVGGGAGHQGPTTPGKPAGPTTGGIRGGGPTTSRRTTVESPERWEFWWEANQELYLRLRARAANTTPSASAKGDVPPVRRVSAADVRALVLPALLTALSDREADVADSAALALARCVTPDQANLALDPLLRALDHQEKSVRESATLALGVLGSPDALPALRALLLDEPDGRRMTAHPAGVEEQVRAFAAASIGLIGDAAGVPDLVQSLESAQARRSVSQLAVLSLGLARGRPSECAARLLKTMTQRELDPLVRAHAPIALARLAETPEGESAARATLGALVTALLDDATAADVRRSTAIALGRLARIEDQEAVLALQSLVQRGSDGPARQLALIALAEIGARDAEARRHGEAQQSIERFLLGQLGSPARGNLRPFAALALGIWGRNEALMPDARERAIAKLLERLNLERNASHRAALSLALALLDSRESIKPIAHAFAETRDASRGYVALALGILRAREHAGMLRSELEEHGIAPLAETQIARALGLMGDPRVVPVLVDRLRRANTFAEVSAHAQALGWIGDASALEPLLALLNGADSGDAKSSGARRGVAAVALGLLAQKTELPWKVVFTAGSNYCARDAALAEIADIL